MLSYGFDVFAASISLMKTSVGCYPVRRRRGSRHGRIPNFSGLSYEMLGGHYSNVVPELVNLGESRVQSQGERSDHPRVDSQNRTRGTSLGSEQETLQAVGYDRRAVNSEEAGTRV
jgi:hypothetical protein